MVHAVDIALRTSTGGADWPYNTTSVVFGCFAMTVAFRRIRASASALLALSRNAATCQGFHVMVHSLASKEGPRRSGEGLADFWAEQSGHEHAQHPGPIPYDMYKLFTIRWLTTPNVVQQRQSEGYAP